MTLASHMPIGVWTYCWRMTLLSTFKLNGRIAACKLLERSRREEGRCSRNLHAYGCRTTSCHACLCPHWCCPFGKPIMSILNLVVDQSYSTSFTLRMKVISRISALSRPTTSIAKFWNGIAVQVVFGGFSAESLSQRILDCKPKIVLTSSGVRRGSKVINLKEIVDDALRRVSNEGFTVGKNSCTTQLSISIRSKVTWSHASLYLSHFN